MERARNWGPEPASVKRIDLYYSAFDLHTYFIAKDFFSHAHVYPAGGRIHLT